MSDLIRLFKVAMSSEAKVRVGEVLDSGYIGQGPRVDEFERALERDGLGDDVITVNSGTSAIDLALHLCGVGPGSEVVSTAMTCTATNTMLVNRGARIVWADVHPLTGCIDPVDVQKKVTRHTKAVIAVDWGGRRCDYTALRAAVLYVWLDKNPSVPIIQDAAHSYTSAVDRVSPRSPFRADYTTYSFQAIKHLTTGDGGALVVPREQRERARLLRWYGLDRTRGDSFRCAQTIHEAGYKYHMNDIAASIGLANIDLARKNVALHRQHAAHYQERLRECAEIELPPFDHFGSYWLYTILVEDRDGFIERMRDRDVECSPVHARNDKHPAFRGWGGPLPGLDHFASREVAIPVGWWLSDNDLERVVDAVLACVRG